MTGSEFEILTDNGTGTIWLLGSMWLLDQPCVNEPLIIVTEKKSANPGSSDALTMLCTKRGES